jgi:hypothetical protein
VEVMRAVMAKDGRLSVRMIAEETDLDKNAVHRILTETLVHTNNTVNDTKQTIHTTTQKLGRVRAVPRLCGFYPGICLTTEEKKHVKTLFLQNKSLAEKDR